MVKQKISDFLKQATSQPIVDVVIPPDKKMGDFSYACFEYAKQIKKSPAEAALDLKEKLSSKLDSVSFIERLETTGPYLNFYLNTKETARLVLENIEKQNDDYGSLSVGGKQKVLVEFGCPNTHKAFHIGHLRNIITGESIVRLFENGGYKVKRLNYQGDVGMHIAKCFYAILDLGKNNEFEKIKNKTTQEKVDYLGKMYALGANKYEDDEEVKEEIIKINEKIYTQSKDIKEVYKTTRQWSLDNFERIYKRVGTHFDKYYFESGVFKRGLKFVKKYLKKGIFKRSQGAIIFPGSKYDLHDRVFVNQKGFPTYEGKEVGLASLHLKNNPCKIIHVVGKEQAEYFKVIFKVLEQIFPKQKEVEEHVSYGWVSLKSGKMSSRTGVVVLGEWLLDELEKEIKKLVQNTELDNEAKEDVIKKVALSATKYSFLRVGVLNDVKFDLEESINLNGDSGPYLLYMIARIKSILKKSEVNYKNYKITNLTEEEKNIILKLDSFTDITKESLDGRDPSLVARYLFELAKLFSVFYENCPVLKADEDIKIFRLNLIDKVRGVLERGLYLLGIESVEKM